MTQYRIDVKVDPSGAKTGARAVRGELDKVNRSADRVGRTLRQAFAFAGVGAAFAGMTRLLANYEQQMSTVLAITKANTSEFKALREETQRLGITTRFSASEAAEAMTFLARAGFSTREVYQATSQVLLLAQAGNLGLAESADIASNILSGFNITAAESGRVVDVLALAANSSNTNVMQLGQAMSFVAPASAAVGVSIEATAAAISALSDAGIQGTRAGTGLRQIFIQLEEQGGSLSVAGNGLANVLETLRDRNIGLTEATELVGARQATSLLVMVKSLDKIKELDLAYQDAAGSAERIAKVMDDNLNGALLSAKSAMQGLVIALGEAGATSALTGVFAAIAEALRYLADNTHLVVSALEFLVIVLGVKLVRTAIPAAIGALRALGAALLANPIGIIAGAIGLVIAAFIAFSDQVKLSANGVGTAFDFITTMLGDLISLWRTGITFMLGLFGDFENVLGSFQMDVFVLKVAGGMDKVIAVILASKEVIVATWKNLPAVIGDAVISTLNLMITRMNNGVDLLLKAWENFPEALGKLVTAGLDKAFSKVGSFINNIKKALNEIPGVALSVGEELIPSIVSPFEDSGGLIPQLKNPFAGAGTELGATFTAAYKEAVENGNITGYIEGVLDRAEAKAVEREKIRANNAVPAFADLPASAPPLAEETPGGGSKGNSVIADRIALIDKEVRALARQGDAIALVGDARGVANAVLAIEDQIRNDLRESNKELTDQQLNDLSRLTEAETQAIETGVRRNLELERQSQIIEELRGEQEQLTQQINSLESLYQAGVVTIDEYTRKLRDLGSAQLDLTIQNQEGSFAEGFLHSLDRMSKGISNFKQSAGQAFGDFFGSIASGAADSIGRAIVFSENLGESLMGVAKNALAALISGLVEMGIQFAINAVIGQSLSKLALVGSVAEAAIIASAWAPAAALVSLATGGANSIGASAGIASTSALSATIATLGAFAEGGQIKGPGTGTSDSILARLSDGEFIINAKSTAAYLPLLEAINSNAFASGGLVGLGFGGSAAKSGGSPPSPGYTYQAPRTSLSNTSAQGHVGYAGSPKITVNNYGSPQEYEIESVTRDEVRLIARDIVNSDTPKLVAGQLRKPNSVISESLSANTSASRRR